MLVRVDRAVSLPWRGKALVEALCVRRRHRLLQLLLYAASSSFITSCPAAAPAVALPASIPASAPAASEMRLRVDCAVCLPWR